MAVKESDKYPGFIITNTIHSKEQVISFTEGMINYLFPVVNNEKEFLRRHMLVQDALKNQLTSILLPLNSREDLDIYTIVDQLFAKLTEIRDKLILDAELILAYDPAAYSLEEVILTYPSFTAISVYRIAHELYKEKIPLIPRMMAEWAHSRTGIDINPGATIGCPFFIDHGTGVVIGETSVIGDHVKIYQGVTLGALSVKKELAQTKRHPTIEDNVVIYAGSTILGGKTTIGRNSMVGGNTWITESIPPRSTVYHKNQITISDRKE
ncbi:MAG: serine acetyltransferase [Chitinophagaceae bacterium]|nr:serine acetyltransferase [Chitinophagaceae bacterium]